MSEVFYEEPHPGPQQRQDVDHTFVNGDGDDVRCTQPARGFLEYLSDDLRLVGPFEWRTLGANDPTLYFGGSNVRWTVDEDFFGADYALIRRDGYYDIDFWPVTREFHDFFLFLGHHNHYK